MSQLPCGPVFRPGVAAAAGVLVAALASAPAAADDWPQWFGPERNGEWNESGIVSILPPDGLPVKWRTPISGGYSGPVVAQGKVVVTDFVRSAGNPVNDPNARSTIEGNERVVCLDQATGKVLWVHPYACSYNISYPAGPRATPTIDQQRVYTLGADGDLLCLDLESGQVLWSKNFRRDYQASTPMWGHAASPLVVGDLLISLVGGEGSTVVAFDKRTGQERWRALEREDPGYSSPTLIHAGGVDQLVVWDPENVNSLDPATGRVYWSIRLRPDYGMSIMSPRQAGDYLFVSGIGRVGAVFRLASDAPQAEAVWYGDTRKGVYCAISTPLIRDGVIYGVSCDSGQLQAVDLLTGERLWGTFEPTTGSRPAGHGTAFLVRNGDRYFLWSEKGDLILASLTPEGYTELGRVHVLDPTGEAFGRKVVWSYPAFADRCLFVRNDREILCASLADEGPAR